MTSIFIHRVSKKDLIRNHIHESCGNLQMKKHFRANRQTQVIIDVFHVQTNWYLNTSSFFVLQMSKWIEYKRTFFNKESLRQFDSISAIAFHHLS